LLSWVGSGPAVAVRAPAHELRSASVAAVPAGPLASVAAVPDAPAPQASRRCL